MCWEIGGRDVHSENCRPHKALLIAKYVGTKTRNVRLKAKQRFQLCEIGSWARDVTPRVSGPVR